MLCGEKILVTGPAGQIAAPLCRFLAADNEVWGIARFGAPGARAASEALGVTTRVVDLADGDFSEVPTDFTYLLHLAAAIGPSTDYDQSLRVNAEATGLLLSHCRKVKAALVMSTCSVYNRPPTLATATPRPTRWARRWCRARRRTRSRRSPRKPWPATAPASSTCAWSSRG
jgi:nucleoside-diphosphate-sugar epimerase